MTLSLANESLTPTSENGLGKKRLNKSIKDGQTSSGASLKMLYIRQEDSGYCAPGCIAILVSLVDPKATVDQKELIEKYAPHFKDWGVTNEETTTMARVFFNNVESQENTSWAEVTQKLKLNWAVVIDFLDDTVYEDGSKSTPDGHSIIITGVDLKKGTILIIDPTHKPKVFSYKGSRYRIFDQGVDIPLRWLDERWHDEDINGQQIIRWAMFVDLKSYKWVTK